MAASLTPLKAERFCRAALDYMAAWKGSYIHDAKLRDHLEKTETVDAGYGRWLDRLMAYLTATYRLSGRRVLDFGCGTGELTVRLRTLGYEAIGFDLHGAHMALARVLAEENAVPTAAFVLGSAATGRGGRLPFDDGSFDAVLLLSVLEHMSDAALADALREIRRVCRGVAYVLVPNRLKAVDDHTGLKGVCWLPHGLAAAYVRLRGRRHRYHISTGGVWDVYYRTSGRIGRLARRQGFRVEWPPDDLVFPPLHVAPPITRIGKQVRLGGKMILVGVPLSSPMFRLGQPPQAFFPYLNMVLVPE